MKILEDDLQEQLLTRLGQGDEPAFNMLYKAYSRPLFLRVVNMVKNEDDAQEIIQELFIKLWENRSNIKTIKSFQSYIFTIAKNQVYNYFRKINNDQGMIQKLLLNAADYYLDGQKLMENKETAEIFEKAIDQLTPQCKRVFQLCKLEGKSHREVAQIMGISMPTVNSHMTIAVKMIRDYILKNQDIAILLITLYTLTGMKQ